MAIERNNLTLVSEFILMDISADPKKQQLLFILFLSMYLVTGLGNLLIILAITTDTRLHNPMYFFLANLAFVDICFTTTTIPKMLVNHVTGHKGIPYAGCLAQTFFFMWFGAIDCFLLGAMAYDRYAAICHPLHYATTVTPQLCILLLAASWTTAFGNSLTHTLSLTRLSFCTHHQIPNFFCDLSAMLKLACSDTFLNYTMVNTVGTLPVFFPFVGILVSYMCIVAAVMRIPSTKGKWKAFSTCGSHLCVVSLFYGTIIGVYFNPTSSHMSQKDTAAAVMYTVVTPMLNPFIYSFRNNDMKGALGALIKGENLTLVSEFILMDISADPKKQQLLFILFLSMYLVTGLGNLLIILAITTDTRLHNPMYFFLANLAFVDICFTTTTIPKMLVNHVTGHKGIPYAGCLAQTFFFMWFGAIDCFLLGAMAYDRYAAICHPLHYATTVTPQLCILLLAASWTTALGNALTHTLSLTRLSFCTHHQVPNFFCDLSAMLKLACSDTFLNYAMVNTMGTLPVFFPFVGILVSYMLIFAAVMRIPSTKGKWKAFSTCGSHLSVVSLFYGTLIGVFFNPTSSHIAQKDTAAAVMYTVVTPMLNPFIYSFRNNDMKGALGALISRKPAFTP
ncbi:Olfactory receptor 1F1 [Galemys pyrenaicus]|uniref:Olfactory receptor 1F1 n=1 Tax=Galemys pyrenaicus TaxID=202257 RepID=A0A8J6AVC0_GALPY|nr:Olfactory receptor 1F1 [Galemys pyrenaicus]